MKTEIQSILLNLHQFLIEINKTYQSENKYEDYNSLITKFFVDFHKNGIDFEELSSRLLYFISITDYFPNITKNNKNDFEKNQDNFIFENQINKILYYESIEYKLKYEEEKKLFNSEIPRLESTISSLNTILKDEQNIHLELEAKLQKQSENNRNMVESLRSRINSDNQIIHDLESKIISLQKENIALAKSKGKNVVEIQNELTNLREELSNKTEKIRILEEQNRQTLLIYASEISELKNEINN